MNQILESEPIKENSTKEAVYLFLDTETSGFMKPIAETLPKHEQPWVAELGMILANEKRVYNKFNVLIQSDGRRISEGAEAVHKISVEMTDKAGIPEDRAAKLLIDMLNAADVLVCHNVGFDVPFISLMLKRCGYTVAALKLESMPKICTMKATTDYCQLPGKYPGSFKWPKLEELHQKLFGFGIEGAHNALVDTEYTMKCFFVLNTRGIL